MADFKKKNIVYLFGAGATHAELAELATLTSIDPAAEEFKKKKGLLIGNISDRVIVRARRRKRYLKDIEMVSSPTGSLNIELLISLIESSRIKDSVWKTAFLKDLVRKDITKILTARTVQQFYLHKALLELHEHGKSKKEEKLLGLISLNYDTVLDKAYTAIYKKPPYYSFSLDDREFKGRLPLLKLHGSFNWDNMKILGRKRGFEIIPLGASKNYTHIPYNFIWCRALELLIQCDVLRIIGCSLNQNDVHLIDLLFKAHLQKGRELEVQIVGPEEAGRRVQQTYGFFPKVKGLAEIEPPLVGDTTSGNAFKAWLKAKSRRVLGEDIRNTRHLKKLIN